jgi:large subunit ribosomal protein L6
MSRIGKLPVEIPNGVTVTVNDGNVVSVKGPKGELTQKIHTDMQVILEGNILKVERPSNSKHHRSLHGLSRSLLNNMIEGVTKGYEKSLEISGVGYRAQKQGKKLVLTVGYSHPVEIPGGMDMCSSLLSPFIPRQVSPQHGGMSMSRISHAFGP